jgi:SAM-dependent methyltransferase
MTLRPALRDEALLLRAHVAGKRPADGDAFVRAYERFFDRRPAHYLAANPSPRSRFIAEKALRGPSTLALMDVWTALLDRNSILRHKLTLALALAECDPAVEAAFRLRNDSRGVGHERWALVRDILLYALLLPASAIVATWYSLLFVTGIGRGTAGNVLEFAPGEFDNSDPRVSHAAEEAPRLVEMAMRGKPRTAVDMGTGSGYVAIELAKRGVAVVASDINPVALEVAAANAKRQGTSIATVHSDLFASIPERFDVVLFNPPLMPAKERSPEVPNRLSQLVRRFRLLTRLALRITPVFYGSARRDLLTRFLDQARGRLTGGGSVIVYITRAERRWLESNPTWRIAEVERTSFGLLVTRLRLSR